MSFRNAVVVIQAGHNSSDAGLEAQVGSVYRKFPAGGGGQGKWNALKGRVGVGDWRRRRCAQNVSPNAPP